MNNKAEIRITNQSGTTKQIVVDDVCKKLGMTKEEFYDAINDLVKNRFLIAHDGAYDFYEFPYMK